MNIPDDILFPILSISPVKCLLRFMCVSKSWNSLIASSAFIAAHHHYNQVNRNDNDKNSYLLYMPINDLKNPSQVCTILRENNDAPPSSVKHGGLVLPLSKYNVVGVCEGLICLTKEHSHNIISHIYIWNPLVGTLKLVTPSETVVFGFGSDKNDYRIIKIIYHGKCLHEVEIYSLTTDSWRRIECKPAKWWWINFQSIGVFLEGSIYWLSWTCAGYWESHLILRFDLDEEIFEEMVAPPSSNICKRKELAMVNGFLVLLEAIDMWEGSARAWVKKGSLWIYTEEFVLPAGERNPRFMQPKKSGHLVFATTEDDGRATQDRRVFACDYNIFNGWTLREMKISWTMTMFDLVRVRETLFLLNEQHKNGYKFSDA
ncbi:hypothetical protein BUALT_Bualt18G0045200 [Buddleja alternifolia]|uniref:F-box domain-containing protein n=1 Tax=Buddleja alternifolia TaxID=168488 RepID=A0AAV6W1V9_9LAMI|nr:hypothetical protein BUALT_Bualt18G0045200 [Buddleja alternifolia]